MNYFLYIILISILLINSIIILYRKEDFIISVPKCTPVQVITKDLDELRYVKCIGLLNVEYKKQLNKQIIPCYNIHKSFDSLNSIVNTVANEMLKIYNINQKTGSCIILISKIGKNKLDTIILFPDIEKNLKLFTNKIDIANSHRWVFLLTNHPSSTSALSSCGLLTHVFDKTLVTPLAPAYNSLLSQHTFDNNNNIGDIYNVPFSHCDGEKVLTTYDPKYFESNLGFNYNSYQSPYKCMGRYSFYYKNCGCSSKCDILPKLGYSNKNPDAPKQTHHFVMYIPDRDNSLFSRFGKASYIINLSYLIDGQNITKESHTFLISENLKYKLGLDENGFYLYNDFGKQTTYIFKSKMSGECKVYFESSTLYLSRNNVIIWNKKIIPDNVNSTPPYVFQLTDDGKFSAWDIKGLQFFI